MKTHLSQYGIGKATIDEIVARFTKRGYNMGERANISPEKIRLILEERL